MSDARLKTKIRQLVQEHLAPEGFMLRKPRMPERHLAGLRQSLEFQPGASHLSGRFTINVCWTFMLGGSHEGVFHARRRIGELAGGADIWYSREPAQLDEDFGRASALILRVAVPYLQRYASVQSIITSYEQGELTVRHAFGPDRGWQLFHLGFCYTFLGRTDVALTSLRALVRDHSSDPWEWVQQRKAQAERELARLSPSQRARAVPDVPNLTEFPPQPYTDYVRAANQWPGVDAGWRLLSAFQRPRPRATQARRWTE